uniref:Fungal lipase-type domain-containing protein n=1 Tax=Musa acuminata subsp. malaccensis TaxID=214687 RepID=A0A804L6G1_MUSAM
METSSASDPPSVSSRQSYVFPLRMMRLWPGGRGGLMEKGSEEAGAEDEEKREEAEEDEEAEEGAVLGEKRGNWVQNILRVGSIWPRKEAAAATDNREEEAAVVEEGDVCVGAGCAHGFEGCVVGGEEAERMAFDRESFSRLLRRVTLAEARLFGKMAYLCSLAYITPNIKPKGLLKRYALRFVTSSFDQRGKSSASDKKQTPVQDQELEEITSAASYLHGENEEKGTIKSLKEMSFVATTNSVTAVVAGKEEMKDAVAKDLNSAKNSPCEWYICDDDSSSTRYFVIQGSESLASWQANLLFEPIQFEVMPIDDALDVLVHRGIYEVAKGMYQQMLPEIKAHLESHGDSATLRFTGHSLGGSLALLLNLMLIIRGEAPASSLLPVITFGSPSIMCGGDSLLHKLGLTRSHVQAITMHRDIVPRAFSCHYPDHVAKILKAVNHNFRRHPCLMKQAIMLSLYQSNFFSTFSQQKLLYAPMGRLLILQPEDEFSPYHHLLPPGSGLYVFGNSSTDSDDSERLLQAARSAFINSPHPLEILSDRTAYGSEGAVSRDHDMRSYLTSVRAVIRHELILIRKVKRERCRRKVWWPLLIAVGSDTTKRHSGFSSFFLGERNQ